MNRGTRNLALAGAGLIVIAILAVLLLGGGGDEDDSSGGSQGGGEVVSIRFTGPLGVGGENGQGKRRRANEGYTLLHSGEFVWTSRTFKGERRRIIDADAVDQVREAFAAVDFAALAERYPVDGRPVWTISFDGETYELGEGIGEANAGGDELTDSFNEAFRTLGSLVGSFNNDEQS